MLLLLHYFSLMESLSIPLSSSPISPKNPKIHKIKTPKFNFNLSPDSIQTHSNFTNKNPQSTKASLKTNLQSLKSHSLSFIIAGFQFPQPSIASEELSINQSSDKIDLEAIVVSIDDFFNRYPFFVAGVVFIWLFVIPVTQEYLRKYKFISAIDAFKKLKDDQNAQLLDIRDSKTLRVLPSPNLKLFNKNAVQVEFRDGFDEDDFVKKVKEGIKDPANTTVCILDNFDGESMKVAELLFNNGFKEAYAIRGGVRGDNGWLEIQETLLPPSVHISLKRKAKKSTEAKNNGAIEQQQSKVNSQLASAAKIEQTNNGHINTSKESKARSSSPYPMYPDLKPPSSPTPSKPQ